MSYWDDPRPVLRSRAVDLGDLGRESAALLDAGGLRALTLRAVASRLGVAPASLYSRVSGVDDLFDMALDHALGADPALEASLRHDDIADLALSFHRHLRRHPWACQVLAFRAPRGPHYLQLSERLCVLLAAGGVADPLGAAYALSNFVIGCATTAPMADHERRAPVDAGIAPTYARLHASHGVSPEEIARRGIAALLARSPG